MYSLRWRQKRGASIGLFLVKLVGWRMNIVSYSIRGHGLYTPDLPQIRRPCCPLRKVDRTHTTPCSVVLQCYDIVESPVSEEYKRPLPISSQHTPALSPQSVYNCL